MADILQAVEQYLVGEGIDYQRSGVNEITFRYRYGDHEFGTEIEVEGTKVSFTFVWNRTLAAEHRQESIDVLTRIINAGTKSGRTLINRKTGVVLYSTSTEMIGNYLTPAKIGDMLGSFIDPFHIAIFLALQVFGHGMPIDIAADSFGAWDRKRVADMIQELITPVPIDPTLN